MNPSQISIILQEFISKVQYCEKVIVASTDGLVIKAYPEIYMEKNDALAASSTSVLGVVEATSQLSGKGDAEYALIRTEKGFILILGQKKFSVYILATSKANLGLLLLQGQKLSENLAKQITPDEQVEKLSHPRTIAKELEHALDVAYELAPNVVIESNDEKENDKETFHIGESPSEMTAFDVEKLPAEVINEEISEFPQDEIILEPTTISNDLPEEEVEQPKELTMEERCEKYVCTYAEQTPVEVQDSAFKQVGTVLEGMDSSIGADVILPELANIVEPATNDEPESPNKEDDETKEQNKFYINKVLFTTEENKPPKEEEESDEQPGQPLSPEQPEQKPNPWEPTLQGWRSYSPESEQPREDKENDDLFKGF
jgi:predicted regulator of Ras-like GTPase activity (Roadblock/LC7/MglB family)